MDIDIKKIFREMRKGAREISKSYIAAYLDGEGCINISLKRQTPWLQIEFTQTNQKVLKMIQKKYGGRIYERKKIRNPNWKNSYSLMIFRINETTKFFIDIYPYVIQKRKQIRVAFIYLWLKSQFSKQGRSTPKDIEKLLLQCKKLMNMLNKTGNFETTGLEENIERSLKGLLFQVGELTVKESNQLKLF